MTRAGQKRASFAVAAFCALCYGFFLRAPLNVYPDGTVEGGGMGSAIEMLLAGLAGYWAAYFLLDRRMRRNGTD